MITSASDIKHPYSVNKTYTPDEARRYCEKLAKSHYENFLIAGIFCPKELRQHFYNVYSYCRISDDLGDEIGDPEQSLVLLDWWESELDLMIKGSPKHPAFVALADTVEQFQIPVSLFRNLLTAFRQDQYTPTYDSYDELLGYCVNSANPVGRLVLYLCGSVEEECLLLSDKICTALQLANFWQDITRDLVKNRIYIPLEDISTYGVTIEELRSHKFTPQFASLMRYEVDRTRALFLEGAALGELVDRRLRLDIEMFSQGGMEVLRKIEGQGYDVLSKRPSIPKSRQIWMLIGRLSKSFSRGQPLSRNQ